MKSACVIEGCDRPQRALKMCHAHWRRRYRGNMSMAPIGDPGVSPGHRVRFPGATRRALNIFYNIEKRCRLGSDKRHWHRYGGRGIKILITPYEIEALWIRDNADAMRQPSFDRKDNDGHYAFDNCRFIEHSENSRQGGLSQRGKPKPRLKAATA